MGKIMIAGSGTAEESTENDGYSNVIITITDKMAVAENGTVTAVCNGRSWSGTIRNGRTKLYTSEIGNYTITAVSMDEEPMVYTTLLVCPYFGRFSTDIQSGSLIVTCTDAGGVGKTCRVQSCDDNYDIINNYDLTMVFGDDLLTSFLGIGAGKYLITVDEKYVFFKHIESIENINSANVELKQWLYKEGDECVHNTGGWMKCAVESVVDTRYAIQYGGPVVSSTGHANAGVTFANRQITFVCNGSSNISISSANSMHRWCRGGAKATVGIGTIKPHINFGKYVSLHVDCSKKQMVNIRSGAANDENTTINTATIIKKGIANNFELSSINTGVAYMVIGIIAELGGIGAASNPGTGTYAGLEYDPGNGSFNNDDTITEIYLV